MNRIDDHARLPAFVPWLIDVQAPASLLCFHCAGGSAQSFFHWKKPAEGVCDLIAVELPGRSRRYGEQFAESVEQLAEEFADRCGALPEKPLIFFGHSLGALLAYETARVLQARGARGPCHLILAARQSSDWVPAFSGLPELNENALRRYMETLDGTPRQVLDNEALMQIALPILQADLELIYRYRYTHGRPLDASIEAIGGIHDAHVRFESLVSWRNATSKPFSLQMIEGGHFTIMDQPDRILNSVRAVVARRAR